MGLSTGLYADQAAGRPLGQVFIGSERSAVGTSALPLNAWSHLATTFDGSVVRLYVNGVLAGSTSVSGSMAASTGVLQDRRQQRLGGVVRRLDRRGARLQPRAHRRRDPAGHADACRRLAAAGRHVAAFGPVRADGVDRDRVGDARLDGVERQRGRRPLQRAPLADRRLHACGREPGRTADGHGLHGLGARGGHLLLPRDGRGRGRQHQRRFGAGDRGRSCRPAADGFGHRARGGRDGQRHGHGDRWRLGRCRRVRASSSGWAAATSAARTRRRRTPSPGTRRPSATAATRSPPSPATPPVRRPPPRS